MCVSVWWRRRRRPRCFVSADIVAAANNLRLKLYMCVQTALTWCDLDREGCGSAVLKADKVAPRVLVCVDGAGHGLDGVGD